MIKLRCNGCQNFIRIPANEDWPDFCPKCGRAANEVPTEVQAPHIAKSIGKNTDKMYRDMEAGSTHRAQMASEITGDPVSEFGDLKITDMKDNLREGDDAAPSVTAANNPVQAVIEQAPQGLFGFQDRGQGLAHSAGVSQGPSPNAGIRMLPGLRSQHQKATGGRGSSDMPANEIRQAGYRPRIPL